MSTLSLGGRQFKRLQKSNFQHDIVLMNHVRAAGVLQLELPDGATGDDFASELLGRLAGYRGFFDLLGCLLVPADADGWDLKVCRESAKHFESLTAPEDKAVLHGVLAELLVSFFQTGRVSLRISRPSSTAPE